jgi:RNA polymerase sigma factor (sigma-70 family)
MPDPGNGWGRSSVSSPMDALTEPAQVARVTEPPFEDFFQAHFERILRVLYLVGGDRHEAEDLAQEALVKAYERWDRIRGLSDPAGYVYRMALNARRSRFRRLALAARKSVGRLEPDPISATDDRDVIRRALRTLPEGQREALVLVEWLGLSDEEAGKLLGVRPVTVRVRISRARPKLQEALRDV